MKHRRCNQRVRQKLGMRIRQRRQQLGLTQRRLTEVARLTSQRHLWAIERGQTGVTIEVVHRIARALGWSLSQLFRGI